MANVLSLGEGERVATCVPVRDFESGGYVLFATKQGKVKKTELSAYSHPRAGGIQAITLEDGDEVDGGPPHRRPARGPALHQAGDDHPVQRGRGAPDGPRRRRRARHRRGRGRPGHRGRGRPGRRRSSPSPSAATASAPRSTSTGSGAAPGKGIIDIKTAGRNGTVVGMLQVREGDDILVVTTKGKMIRVHADDVTSRGATPWASASSISTPTTRWASIARVEAEQAAPDVPPSRASPRRDPGGDRGRAAAASFLLW